METKINDQRYADVVRLVENGTIVEQCAAVARALRESAASMSAITGHAASRTISEISSPRSAALRPDPTMPGLVGRRGRGVVNYKAAGVLQDQLSARAQPR